MKGADMTTLTNLGGSFTLAHSSMTLNRIGYGAMQLAGPGVWGPPRDPDAAVAVLRAAVAAGVNHIDTSDYYGPHVVNRLIRDYQLRRVVLPDRRDERLGELPALRQPVTHMLMPNFEHGHLGVPVHQLHRAGVLVDTEPGAHHLVPRDDERGRPA